MCKTFHKVSHHHNDDHGASEHAGQPGLLWKVGLFDPSHWVFLHSWGHGYKLRPRTLLRAHSDDIRLSGLNATSGLGTTYICKPAGESVLQCHKIETKHITITMQTPHKFT